MIGMIAEPAATWPRSSTGRRRGERGAAPTGAADVPRGRRCRLVRRHHRCRWPRPASRRLWRRRRCRRDTTARPACSIGRRVGPTAKSRGVVRTTRWVVRSWSSRWRRWPRRRRARLRRRTIAKLACSGGRLGGPTARRCGVVRHTRSVASSQQPPRWARTTTAIWTTPRGIRRGRAPRRRGVATIAARVAPETRCTIATRAIRIG
mmetsp:Transcript_108937/g.347801  ORF Transcript_108937/g.347801 Transcript_108937/m.347801 type:complete len:206 (-) Transcript_108937:2807-3424(-)